MSEKRLDQAQRGSYQRGCETIDLIFRFLNYAQAEARSQGLDLDLPDLVQIAMQASSVASFWADPPSIEDEGGFGGDGGAPITQNPGDDTL